MDLTLMICGGAVQDQPAGQGRGDRQSVTTGKVRPHVHWGQDVQLISAEIYSFTSQ